MATKLLIVHGYSDGSTSFTALGDFFIAKRAYDRESVFYLDYSSMDDEATFEDFADKLDTDHRTLLRGERVDVACHSTGSLVVRAWLALHAARARGREEDLPCPVDRLLCFAPANFGSDLAALGQSFLGKFRCTFFNSHSHGVDFMESGKVVLQGLEPASPFQWRLSKEFDLHGADSYFSAKAPESKRCYPFVLAAGTGYTGVQAKLIKQRAKPGTDGTVRIAGTSLNTRCASLDARVTGTKLIWWKESKYDHIPFAVFGGFNHGSIIDPAQSGFLGPDGPGTLALEALEKVRDARSYADMAKRFEVACEANYAAMPADHQDRYQQFFFRVRDDVGELVDDFYIDFHVVDRNDRPLEKLTIQFDDDFVKEIHRHSAAASHRVFLMNCSKLGAFVKSVKAADAKLMLEITGVSSRPDVKYAVSTFVAYDPKAVLPAGEPDLLYPNTTTLIDVIVNRQQTDKLLAIKDGRLAPLPMPAAPVSEPLTGKAVLAAADAPRRG